MWYMTFDTSCGTMEKCTKVLLRMEMRENVTHFSILTSRGNKTPRISLAIRST